MKSYRMNLLVLFRLRYNKKDKSRPAYLYCRITFDGIEARPDFSTKVKIDPKTWDSKNQIILGNDHATYNKNDTLTSMRNTIIDIAKKLNYLNQPLTAHIIKDTFLGKENCQFSFLEIFDKYIKKKEKLVGKGVERRTIESYQVRYKNVLKFLQHIKRVEIEPQNFKEKVAEDFVYWMITENNCSKVYAMKNVQAIKHILKQCIKDEYIEKNPLAYFKFELNKRKPLIFLSVAQLRQLEAHRFTQMRLQQVADLFLFVCYTGLSYVDLKRFCYDENVTRWDDGNLWIFMSRQKSLETFSIPLLKKAIKVLGKYNNVLPVISNQKYNSYLKELGGYSVLAKS